MFGKQPSKAELRQMLQAQCEQALQLDQTIRTTYASQQAPSKGKYRPRKKNNDAFQEEIHRLQQAEETPGIESPSNADPVISHDPVGEYDLEGLQQAAAEFRPSWRRK